MISNKAKQLVQDIFLQISNPRVHDEVREDPEAYLLSLLTQIKGTISGDRKYRVPLYNTVERASYGESVKKAREELEEPVSHE